MLDFRGFNFEKALSQLYVYTGVFLLEHERARFLVAFPPKHANVYADHATLCFKPSVDQAQVVLKRAELYATRAQHVVLQVQSYAEDDKGQAVEVSFPLDLLTGLEVKNPIMHVTISCAVGTSPVYSNELLQKGSSPASGNFGGVFGVCAQTDRNHLPRDQWKRRGLAGA